MRIPAAENIPRMAVEALVAAGHEVSWVRAEMPGADDRQVLAHAVKNGLVLLTFDKDFGDLAFLQRLPHSCGIVLVRTRLPSPELAAQRIVSVLASRTDWVGHFSVIDESGIRMRPLPPTDIAGT
ncbi:MAG: DUF5615 family PIN-like protein [Planctomycetes bacterium]|nr:DUF5615 family PIN-like protein [Planctomycetota bacterium]